MCQSKDIRNTVDMFSELHGCRVIEGFVQIVLIDKAEASDYANITFPELREITGYLLLYRVHGLRSLGKLFPNLNVIRGNTLFLNYALVVYEMIQLQVSIYYTFLLIYYFIPDYILIRKIYFICQAKYYYINGILSNYE